MTQHTFKEVVYSISIRLDTTQGVLLFDPAPDITPLEVARLLEFFIVVATPAGFTTPSTRWEFITKHNLQRHFAETARAWDAPKAPEDIQYCTYPDCNCPFDAPADPNWCARSLPHIPKAEPETLLQRLRSADPLRKDGLSKAVGMAADRIEELEKREQALLTALDEIGTLNRKNYWSGEVTKIIRKVIHQ
jgi:hypothetical protein